MSLTPEAKDELRAAQRDYLRHRRAAQPWHPTPVEEEVCAEIHGGICPHDDAHA